MDPKPVQMDQKTENQTDLHELFLGVAGHLVLPVGLWTEQELVDGQPDLTLYVGQFVHVARRNLLPLTIYQLRCLTC